MHGLGDDEAEVVGEAIDKPLTPVRRGISITERGLHPDFAIAQFDREDWYVVRPQIEGAAAFEIEAGVVPMTGQDAVLDAAALEREAHVRTPIIEGEDAPAVVHDKDRTTPAVENEPALRLQLIKAAREHEFPAWHVHQHSSRGRVYARCRHLNISILLRKRERHERAPRSAIIRCR
jgi:hypothetical protein